MVKVTAERIPDSQVLLNIEVEPERIEQSVEKAYRKLVGRLSIPGFRRGKAPRHIVERYVGRDALIQEGLEQLVNDVLRDAIKELGLRPIDRPDLDLEPKAEDLKPGDALRVKATIPVEPVVELGDYRSIRVVPLHVRITEYEVNRTIDRLQELESKWVPVTRQVKDGDRVVMDVEGKVGTYARLYSASGEPLLQSGGGRTILSEKKTELEIDVSDTRFPESFVNQVIGMVPGQEKQFELSLPADYEDRELANRLALYKVKVYEVREKRVPPVDDEFAKAAGYDSLAQMREDLRGRAQAEAEAEAQRVFRETVLREVVARSVVELPTTLVEREIDHLVEHVRESLREQQLDLEQYLKMARKSDAELREELREQAIQSLKTALVIERIAEQENVQVDLEEVDRELNALRSQRPRQGDRVRQSAESLDREAVEHRIRHRKAVQILLDVARSDSATAESAADGKPTETEAPTDADAHAAQAEPEGSSAGGAERLAVAPVETEVAEEAGVAGPEAAATELDKE